MGNWGRGPLSSRAGLRWPCEGPRRGTGRAGGQLWPRPGSCVGRGCAGAPAAGSGESPPRLCRIVGSAVPPGFSPGVGGWRGWDLNSRMPSRSPSGPDELFPNVYAVLGQPSRCALCIASPLNATVAKTSEGLVTSMAAIRETNGRLRGSRAACLHSETLSPKKQSTLWVAQTSSGFFFFFFF